jgi:hypothetical protein
MIALWVRSYWWMDNFQKTPAPGRLIQLVSIEGQVIFETHTDTLDFKEDTMHIHWSWPLFEKWQQIEDPAFRLSYDDQWPETLQIRFPYWFAVLLVAASAAAPWIRHFSLRFSLRTLLLATTLVAAVLGLLVLAVR